MRRTDQISFSPFASRRLPRLGCAALLATLLASCTTVGPDFAAPPVEAPATFDEWHSGSPQLAASGSARAVAPFSTAILADPTLLRLQALAVQANPDLRTAALRFAQARLTQATVEARNAVQLGAHAAAVEQGLSKSGVGTRIIKALPPGASDQALAILTEPFPLYQAGFDASWELDLWGGIKRATEAAAANSAASEAALRDLRLVIWADVARAYLQVRSVRAQQQWLRRQIESLDDTHALLKAQTERGLADASGPERHQAQIEDVHAQLPGLLELEAAALSRLSLLCGQRPGALAAELPEGSAAAPANDHDWPDLSLGLPSEVMRSRPDIAAAEARLHAATANVGVATADLYPRFTIGASLGLESVSADQFFSWSSRSWSIGPSLSLPIFDGGRRRATVTLRELDQQEAAIAFQRTVLQAWHEIDNAIATYNGERQRRERLLERAQRLDAVAQLAAARTARGLTDELPLLEARRAWLQAQADLAANDNALGSALVAVSKALGADGLPPTNASSIGQLPAAITTTQTMTSQ